MCDFARELGPRSVSHSNVCALEVHRAKWSSRAAGIAIAADRSDCEVRMQKLGHFVDAIKILRRSFNAMWAITPLNLSQSSKFRVMADCNFRRTAEVQ